MLTIDVNRIEFIRFSFFRSGGSIDCLLNIYLIDQPANEPNQLTNYQYQHRTMLWYSPSHYLASQLTDSLKVCICMYGIPYPPLKKKENTKEYGKVDKQAFYSNNSESKTRRKSEGGGSRPSYGTENEYHGWETERK